MNNVWISSRIPQGIAFNRENYDVNSKHDLYRKQLTVSLKDKVNGGNNDRYFICHYNKSTLHVYDITSPARVGDITRKCLMDEAKLLGLVLYFQFEEEENYEIY